MHKIQSFNGRVYETSVEIASGSSIDVQFALATPATLTVHALGDGVSALVEYSTSPAQSVADGTARYNPLRSFGAEGVVADAYDTDVAIGPLSAVRITATGTGPVVVEVLQ